MLGFPRTGSCRRELVLSRMKNFRSAIFGQHKAQSQAKASLCGEFVKPDPDFQLVPVQKRKATSRKKLTPTNQG